MRILDSRATICEDSRVMLNRLQSLIKNSEAAKLFCEEFAKGWRAIRTAYQTMRDVDARTMEILIALIGRGK